jgi:hypothetical protein
MEKGVVVEGVFGKSITFSSMVWLEEAMSGLRVAAVRAQLRLLCKLHSDMSYGDGQMDAQFSHTDKFHRHQ